MASRGHHSLFEAVCARVCFCVNHCVGPLAIPRVIHSESVARIGQKEASSERDV